jgi:hypothetical protein
MGGKKSFALLHNIVSLSFEERRGHPEGFNLSSPLGILPEGD